jgi:dihydrofolate reductase
MGKIVISENITLDGVVQDPTGEESSRHGGWFLQVGDKDREAWGKVEFQEALGAEALLLGRRSYDYFAARWSSRPGEWADRLRQLPKYVVSSTPLAEPDWKNAVVLEGAVADAVSNLKTKLAGEIVVYGSRQLVRTLLDHGLVDEMRLTIYPVVLGAGHRLFDDLADKTHVRPMGTTALGDNLTLATYDVVRGGA